MQSQGLPNLLEALKPTGHGQCENRRCCICWFDFKGTPPLKESGKRAVEVWVYIHFAPPISSTPHSRKPFRVVSTGSSAPQRVLALHGHDTPQKPQCHARPSANRRHTQYYAGPQISTFFRVICAHNLQSSAKHAFLKHRGRGN